MVNWNDPVVLARTYFDFIKLEHALAGVYIWEYVTNLHYEWSFVSRKRDFLWTLSIYSFSRFSCLMFTILNLVGMNVTSPIDCQAWIVSALLFADLALVSAAFLIVLRIAAIWDRNPYIISFASCVWLVNVAFWLHDIIRSKGMWNPVNGGCLDLLTDRGQVLAVATFITDATLLTLMLVGLLAKGEAARFGLWKMLYHQGLVWLTLAIVVEVPILILLFKDINDVWNLMFQTPALLVMVIGATRMYRALSNYGSVTEIASGLPPSATKNAPAPISGLNFGRASNTNGGTTATNGSYAMRPIEIAVHSQRERDPRHGASFDDSDKAQRLSAVDLELGGGDSDPDQTLYVTKEKAEAASAHSSEGL